MVGSISHELRTPLNSLISLLDSTSEILNKDILSNSTFSNQYNIGIKQQVDPEFDIINWRSKTRHRGLLVAGKSTDNENSLKHVLTICDAKSLYDHLSTETSGTSSDKRTAIEIQIVRSSLEGQGAQVRWVDHIGMYTDALTKKDGNVPLIQTLMRTARV